MDAKPHLNEQMAGKTDQQLVAMFSKPDDWTPEALDAARAELQNRKVPIPPPPPPPSGEEMRQQRKRDFKRIGWFLLIVGLIASGICGNIDWNSAVVDAFLSITLTACWITGIVYLIRAARIKIAK